MVKPSESSYGTVPRGHQSPLRSTASDTSVVSKRSHATIRHPRSRSVSNPPFQISLNLVMKVQPLDNDEYCLEPIELCLNDVNMSKNGQQQHQLSHRKHGGPAEKKNNQTPGNRYKNKRSLLAFSSLQKQPRKKSSVRFDDDLPRRLNFDQSDDEDEVAGSRSPVTSTPKDSQADKKKSQTTGNRYKNKQSLLKFPSVEKARSKSEGHALPGFEPYSPPRPLNFSDTARLTEGDETALMKSGAADKTFPLDKTFQNSLGLGVSNLDDSVFTNGKNDGKKDSSFSSTASTSFTDVSPKDVACDLDAGQASKIYDHQKQMRIGFLANGIPMAVNLVLNLRSDEEVLYLEPVELIYEREKMWRRPIRQVAKEIEEKRLADKMKKETLNASKATSGSSKSTPTSPNVSK